jgi:hypothetical protein
MKISLTLLLFIILLTFSNLNAQTTFSGSVKDTEERKVMSGVSVTVKAKGTTGILNYALTDEKGNYKLTFKSLADSVIVSLSGMSIKKQVATYANKDKVLNFKVDYEQIVLKEMKVKPPKILRLDDTLNYDVAQFTGRNDRTIGEVLKRMPGIKVAENGSISYNGKPINRFYIDNQDMLEGRYGIATNNVEAKDVATVQVLENHQPIKALKGREFRDEGAINLKLKESAKNVLVANAQIGLGGAPILWNNEAFGMYFGKGKQFMATYKGNNTGDDSSGDLQNFFGGDESLSFPIGLGIQSPPGPGVSRRRYLLNNDHAVSINNLRSLGKDYKLTANVGYATDRQQKDSYSRVENYLPGDSTLVIEERINALEQYHYLDGTVKLNANTDKYFFDNSLRFNGDLERNDYGSVRNAQFIEQNRSAPYFRISNNLAVIKNFKKTTFRLNSYNGYGRINDELDVQPMLYPTLFPSAALLTGLNQLLAQNVFYSTSSIGFGVNHGKFRQNYTAGFNANVVRLNSALSGIKNTTELAGTVDSLRNDINFRRYDSYLSPEYVYSDKVTNISLRLPLTHIYQGNFDRLRNEDQDVNRLFFTPLLTINYRLNILWQLGARAGFSRSLESLAYGFRGYVMESYRSFIKNEGQLPESNSLTYGLDLKYSHPITQVFGNLTAGFYNNRNNLLFGTEFQGFLAVRRTLAIPNSSSGYNLSFNIGKGFDGTLRKIDFSAGYNNSESIQLNQLVLTQFQNRYYNSSLNTFLRFLEWADFSYGITYARSENFVENDNRNFEPIEAISQVAVLNLFPVKKLILNLKYDYSYNSAVTGSGRMMNFADATIRYKLKNVEFSLNFNNILNTRRYITAAYSGIGSYYASYDLRPTQVLAKVRFKIK